MFVVAAALVDQKNNILVQQRPEGKPMAGLWEFPGGKVEAGETPEDALIRELDEELGLVVKTKALSPVAFASEPLGSKHLLLLLYTCHEWTGQAVNLEAAAMQWLPVQELKHLDMPPADQPLVEQLLVAL
ncbi:(deoxy)nucleoside triphosphate pyrophosphohydrolase [Parasphingorhabdus cellanae]|uniref:8-oxo-dGTP diphosphatase n=1 Tax=Parasphingorhabdus cellanae TaxID=2806553 RepID=A0ABX7TAH6_9SPHN|nr:(deoxy)nucleoside triphosphate pyrophosphohydrolase [Parasphingorhabdus cellanae]